MQDVIVRNLSLSYDKGSTLAVKNANFSVDNGELFGLIGPDGAGKTSIFRMIATLILPTEGSILVMNVDAINSFGRVRRDIGYMPGKFSLYQDLTIEENMVFFSTLFGTSVKENYDTIRDIYVQLEPFKDRRAGKLSGGMKQKLALCCALIHKPKVLILDEPTTGVDAVSRKEFWEMLVNIKSHGITILVSTPYMDEALLCDRIALIQQGQIMRVDTPSNIINSFDEPLFSIKANNMSLLLKELRNSSWVKSCYSFGEHHHLTLKGDSIDEAKLRLIDDLKMNFSLQDIELEVVSPSVEDCFIKLMH